MNIYEDEHIILQHSIRQFAEKEILPFINSWEEKKFFPSELFKKLGDQGFLGILIDESWGGVGKDYTYAAAWCEEFGRIPAIGLTTGVNMHSLVITPTVQRFGTEEAKSKWIPLALEGMAIGAYAFTEPGAGSDLSKIQTRAIIDGDYFIINGSKIFITNGARASFVLVLAKTDSSKGYDGYTTFIVDTSLPGFQVSRSLDKLGWHCSDTAELSFSDVRVHKSMVLGQVGAGWKQAMASLEWERLMLSLAALGGASRCIEQTVEYINTRHVFGSSIGSYDYVREELSRYAARLEASRALCHKLVKSLSQGEKIRRDVSLLKLHVCELAIKIADFCLQLHGGYGYTSEFPPERWLRDLRLNTIGGGTSQIMSRVACKEIFS